MLDPVYKSPWWLKNAHLQTTWARLIARRPRMPLEREYLGTPDGDQLILDHLAGPAPVRLILLHGLEGSSFSGYIQGLLALARGLGWRATALNFRSCARQLDDVSRTIPNGRPRLYHSGETTDFDLVARTLASREPRVTLFAAGVSLGGNVLLKWLGENRGQTVVRAAATISVPYDLAAGARHLARLAGGFYARFFLKTLRPKAVRMAAQFPEAAARIDVLAVRQARTFYEFDGAATAPLHGFRDADDYYARCSSIHLAGRIDTPALCVSAEDDPFLPREVLPRFAAAVSPAITFALTPSGGHVGFVDGLPWRCSYWAEEYVASWLADRI